jgi:hypothetical protein
MKGSRLDHLGKMAAIGLKFLRHAIVWALEPAMHFQAEGDCGEEAKKVKLVFQSGRFEVITF